ncbi:peptide/nickel transport system ATP-binding protein [Branchiibius hedensis]|uniref:Peptide/nickel transport system ATP-binding protein n=1 Tax=Branchiibius hedensis TaxID=672460 RepID=A0A2Y8ZUH0_9MICO|nr:ABC transporter ATP-binding protein [Branchiibius hedensis]PWJ24690.1 peptide/nickel transport system ATP-binding protein [Branchiibius hedensis]SSA33507.1 peptide/nickel transport system ATP-binding protein [Branchiibius hedensis]
MTDSSEGLQIEALSLSIDGVPILKNVDLIAPPATVTGLAGESGSGKTMTGMTVLGLQPSRASTSGSIRFEGQQLLGLRSKDLNRLRGHRISMIFQDPTASLHPMLSIGQQLTDHQRYHLGVSKREALSRAGDLLQRVQVPDPEAALDKYVHQFSGGQLQRICIASALACDPRMLIADEPTTALDVTVQAGILRLLRQVCDDLKIGIVLITHDLGVMSALADTITVMRNGSVVEHGTRQQVITDPQDDYTRSLIDALPDRIEAANQDTAGEGQNG